MDRGDRANFDRLGTIGVEEEFFIVDSAGNPTAGTDDLVYESEPPSILADRIDHELFKCVIETQTPIITDPTDAGETIQEIRQALLDHAANHGYDIAGAGLHPTARWRRLEHAAKPRYRSQLDRIQYPQHRNTTAGVHVHVGVDDADKAVWVANELRYYVPIILALAANSPFWNGYDTGLASARAKIFEALPNTGIPTAFDSYDAFDRFERTMVETASIGDRGELWYDVRPHSGLGTVEVRSPDGQHDIERVSALVSYIHSLVIDFCERYEDGESQSAHRRELLDENKWRALRYGHEATLLGPSLEEEYSLSSLVEREADRLDVPALLDMFEESGAARQRRILQQNGSDVLRESLILESQPQ